MPALFEAKVRAADDPKEAILSGIDIEPLIADTLEYDPMYGGLISRTNEGVRFAIFRAHRPVAVDGDAVSVDDVVNRGIEEASVHNSIYGVGLYAGNSKEAVGLFSYKGRYEREIGLYLTPPYSDDVISDVRSGVKTTKRLRILIGRQVMIRLGNAKEVMNEAHSAYGESAVIIMDKAADTLVAQNMQVKDNTYPVSPVWYLFRGEDIQLQRVATVPSVEPRAYIKKMRGKV